jgi:hypothetical protein
MHSHSTQEVEVEVEEVASRARHIVEEEHSS